jgi:nucleoid-associated protein YgaU
MALMRALIINLDSVVPLPVPVMFNPPEYTLQKSNQFAEIGIPGLASTLIQFVHGSAQTLSMTLFFDTTESGLDVRRATSTLLLLTELNPKTHAPPRLLVVWGSLAFPCVLEQVGQRFTYFNALGMPLRAELDVTFRGSDLVESLLGGIPLMSADKVKLHVVKEGETLAQIAFDECEDPRAWRAIARVNGIINPLVLTAGTRLQIPKLA